MRVFITTEDPVTLNKYRVAVGGTASSSAMINGNLEWAVPSALSSSSDPWTFVKLPNDFVTSSATPQNVVGLSFTPVAGSQYLIDGRMFVRTNTTTVNPMVGLTWSVGLSVGVAIIAQGQAATGALVWASGNTTAALLAPVGGLGTSMGQAWPVMLDGCIVAGASASGQMMIQLRSETAGTTVTIGKHSFIGYRTI